MLNDDLVVSGHDYLEMVEAIDNLSITVKNQAKTIRALRAELRTAQDAARAAARLARKPAGNPVAGVGR